MSSSVPNELSREVTDALRQIALLSDLLELRLPQIVEVVVESTTARAMEALREVDLFQDLEDADLASFREVSVPVKIEEGEMLFEDGESGDAFDVVIAGAAELFKGDGASAKNLTIMGNGDTFGEMSLLNANPRSPSARGVDRPTCSPSPGAPSRSSWGATRWRFA